MKTTVYLSLGSNLGDRAGNLRQAIGRLTELGEVTAVSGLYETEPVEVTSKQPWYVNCAVTLETELVPKQLLSRILAIEHDMGRHRTEAKGPRKIDLDIIFFGNAVVDTPELTIPHPAMQQRRFVLAPLAEIAPEMRHPLLKRTVRDLLAALPSNTGALRVFNPSRKGGNSID